MGCGCQEEWLLVVVALGRANSTGKGLLLHSQRFLSQMADVALHRAILTYQLHASVLTRLQAACCLSQQNMDDKQSHHRIIIEKQDLHACKLDL